MRKERRNNFYGVCESPRKRDTSSPIVVLCSETQAIPSVILASPSTSARGRVIPSLIAATKLHVDPLWRLTRRLFIYFCISDRYFFIRLSLRASRRRERRDAANILLLIAA